MNNQTPSQNTTARLFAAPAHRISHKKQRLAIRLLAIMSMATLILPCAALASGRASGDAEIKGRVIDNARAAVAGATITLSSREGVTWSTISGDDGRYDFGRLAAGEYVLEVEAPRFRKQVETLQLTGREVHVLDVPLQAAGVDDQVVITASGTTQSVDELSKSVTVVDRDTIERRDDLSLADTLRPVPGVSVIQAGGPGAFTQIFIRGLRVVDTSVLIDGFRVRDASDTHGAIQSFLEDFLNNSLGRVEVVRGSGSSLYGSNAVGGVINLVSDEGQGPVRFDLGFEGGSLGLFREHGRISGGISNRLSYSLSATRLDVNDGVQEGEVYRNTSVGAHVTYHLNPSMTLGGTFTYIGGFGRLTDSPFPIGPAGNEFGFATGAGPVTGFVENSVNPDSFRTSRLFTGSARFTDQVNSIYGFSVGFQSVATDLGFNNGPAESQSSQEFGLFEFAGDAHDAGRIQTLNFTNNIQAGRHNLITAGLEYEHESFSQVFTSPGFSTPLTTDRQGSLAFFGQDQVSLLDGRLQLSAAVRSQGFNLSNPESVPQVHDISIKRALTGDGSIAFMIRETGSKLRAHVGNSFRAPSLSERFSIFQGVLIGNPFLQPERGISVDFGVDQSLFHDKLKASATYFYNRLQQVITSAQLLEETNAPGALARGVEVSVAASPVRGLDITAAYTFTNSVQILPFATLRSDNVLLGAGASVPSFSVPRHNFSFDVNHSFRHGVNVDFGLQSVSGHDFPLFDPIFFSEVLFDFKGYTRAHAVASYTRSLGERRAVTLYIKGDNLFDQTIFEQGFRAPGITGLGGIKFRF